MNNYFNHLIYFKFDLIKVSYLLNKFEQYKIYGDFTFYEKKN